MYCSLSPGHSQLFSVFQCAILKSMEWSGDPKRPFCVDMFVLYNVYMIIHACVMIIQQLSLAVLSVLLIGAGRLTSALPLLTHALADSPSALVHYNMSLLRLKIAHGSSLTAKTSQQTLVQLQEYYKDISSKEKTSLSD